MVQFLTAERGWYCCVLAVVSSGILLDRHGAVTTRAALAARQTRDKIATVVRLGRRHDRARTGQVRTSI